MEFSVCRRLPSHGLPPLPADPGLRRLFRDKYNVGTVSWFGPTNFKVSLVIPIGKDSHKVNKN